MRVQLNWSRKACLADSNAESLRRACFRFCGFFLSIPRRGGGFERTEKSSRNPGHFIDGCKERGFVCLRRFVETADFSHELERRRSNLFGRDRRLKVEKSFDIPAHSGNENPALTDGADPILAPP